MRLKKLLLLILMVAAAVAAAHLKPTHKIAADRKDFDLETIIPTHFEDWTLVDDGLRTIVNPEQESVIQSIYSQTISRTYTNSKGKIIMLAIAYGEEQSDNKRLHYPEVCYPAQGFQILHKDYSAIKWRNETLRVKRLFVSAGQRFEQIIYWTIVGNKLVLTGTESKLQQLTFGLRGSIPDGLLFRVSTINNDKDKAFADNAEFVRALLNALPPQDLPMIAGVN